jgi:hypothetical protein
MVAQRWTGGGSESLPVASQLSPRFHNSAPRPTPQGQNHSILTLGACLPSALMPEWPNPVAEPVADSRSKVSPAANSRQVCKPGQGGLLRVRHCTEGNVHNPHIAPCEKRPAGQITHQSRSTTGGAMIPKEFSAKWRHVDLSERSSAQTDFNDLCLLVGHFDPIRRSPSRSKPYGSRRSSPMSTCPQPRAESLGETGRRRRTPEVTSRPKTTAIRIVISRRTP